MAGSLPDTNILLSVSTSLPLLLLDSLLSALTHTSPLRRRTSLVLFITFYLTLLLTFFSLRSTFSLHPSPSSSSSSTKHPSSSSSSTQAALDHLASTYVPLPPTPVQLSNSLHLWSLIESKTSPFPPSSFEPRALKSPSSKVVGVTAVVLHWKRTKGLQMVVNQLSRYPFIREIIVWNNRPGIDLVRENFTLSSPLSPSLPSPLLRIFNSPSNIHDAGKHFACSLASQPHCYFNDDDWLNIHLDSLYTKYLECCAGTGTGLERGLNGGRIASNTLPVIHLEHRRWRFVNSDIDLHTGFTWLGTGSFAPRHLSARFLNQQSSAPVLLKREQTMVSDMFFSLWSNNFPEQMPNNLVPIDIEGGEVGWSRGTGIDQWVVVYSNVLDAIQKLSSILLSRDPSLVPSPFPITTPPPESHTRAPCANDLCLFTTSLSPFPLANQLDYTPIKRSRSWFGFGGGGRGAKKVGAGAGAGGKSIPKFDAEELKHVHEHEKRFNDFQGGWPSDEWWIKNGSWHLAVDGTNGCWESWSPPQIEDSFGLTLLTPRLLHTLTLIGTSDLASIVPWDQTDQAGTEAWVLYTAPGDSSGGWEPRQFLRSPLVTPLSPNRISVTLNLVPLTTGLGATGGRAERELKVGKIKFVSKGKKKRRLGVCEWDLGGGWRI